MKKNELNVLTYGYGGRFGIRNIKQFFRNLKYAKQRIVRGYCDQDVWNLDDYYAELMSATLNHLADTAYGYPGTGEFADENDGYEKWIAYLREMAQHFKNTVEDSENNETGKRKEETFDKMCEQMVDVQFRDSQMVEIYKDKDAYEAAREEWLQAEKDHWTFRQEEKDKALDMMKKVFFSLWD